MKRVGREEGGETETRRNEDNVNMEERNGMDRLGGSEGREREKRRHRRDLSAEQERSQRIECIQQLVRNFR